ncbi:MAG TPA: thioredoxin fold domain-containing protein [Candidatus Edwardsbacteria bacterium]|nr:thioredoxin fold domain-containing protein [Candidatus Edwardsbacteria bacterium]
MRRYLPLLALALLVLSATACKPAASGKTETAAGAANQLPWLAFDKALAQGSSDGKFVVVDFYTDWCHWCKVLDAKTYPDPAVQAAFAKSFALAKVNPEKDNGPYQYKGRSVSGADLAKEFNVQGYPTSVFLDKDGNVCGQFAGYVPPETYVKILDFIAAGDYKKQSLDDFIKGLPQ